VGSWRN